MNEACRLSCATHDHPLTGRVVYLHHAAQRHHESQEYVISVTHSTHRLDNNIMALAPAAAAANKPIKSEGRTKVSLENLFDDLKDEAKTLDVKDDVKKAAPALKKVGNWDSEDAKGTLARTVLLNTLV